MASYFEVNVVVDGAAEDTVDFSTMDAVQRYCAKAFREVPEGIHMDIYVIPHPHRVDVADCECAQFLQDHRPYASNYESMRTHD